MASLLDELKHVHSFLAAQASIMGPAIAAVMEGQASSLIAKIGTLPSLDAVCATELTTCIGSGPWTPDQKNKLAHAVGSRLQISSSSSPPATSCSGRRRSNQVLMSFEKYLKKEHVEYLQSDASDVAKLNALTELCETIGLDIPSEQTVKHIIGVFCSVSKKGTIDHSLGYSYLTEFKRLLKQRPKVFPHQRPAIYPDVPKDLPTNAYQHAYPDGHTPLELGLGVRELQASAAHVACRKSSKLVKQEQFSGHGSLANQLAQAMPIIMSQICGALGQPLPTRRTSIPGLTLIPRRSPQQDAMPLQNADSPPLPGTSLLALQNVPASSTNGATSLSAAAQRPNEDGSLQPLLSQPAHVPIPPGQTPFSLPPVSTFTPSQLSDAVQEAMRKRKAAKDDATGDEGSEEEPGKQPNKKKKLTKAQKIAAAKATSKKIAGRNAETTPGKDTKAKNDKVKADIAITPEKIDKGKSSNSGKAKKNIKGRAGGKGGKGGKGKVRADSLPMAVRLKNRPNGCGRCRHTPGCCPSCTIWK